ncbi:MAG: hypothetical protein ACK5LK_07825 [Chthoniobacterales bacterium]
MEKKPSPTQSATRGKSANTNDFIRYFRKLFLLGELKKNFLLLLAAAISLAALLIYLGALPSHISRTAPSILSCFFLVLAILALTILLHSALQFLRLFSNQKTARWADKSFALSDRMSLLLQLTKEKHSSPPIEKFPLRKAAKQEALGFLNKNHHHFHYTPSIPTRQWLLTAALVFFSLLLVFISLRTTDKKPIPPALSAENPIQRQSESLRRKIEEAKVNQASQKKFTDILTDWQKNFLKLPTAAQHQTSLQNEETLRLLGRLQSELRHQQRELADLQNTSLSREALQALANASDSPNLRSTFSQGQLEKAADLLEANFSQTEQQKILEEALTKVSSESAAAQLTEMLQQQKSATHPANTTTDTSRSLSEQLRTQSQSTAQIATQTTALDRLMNSLRHISSTTTTSNTNAEQTNAATSTPDNANKPSKTLSREEPPTEPPPVSPEKLQTARLLRLESLLTQGESLETLVFSDTKNKSSTSDQTPNNKIDTNLLRKNLDLYPELQTTTPDLAPHLRPEQRTLIRNYFDSLLHSP